MVGLQSNKYKGDRVRVLLCTQLKRPKEYNMVQGENTATLSIRKWSDCDEAPCAKAVLMANLSSYDSAVISDVPISKTIQDNSVFDNGKHDVIYVVDYEETLTLAEIEAPSELPEDLKAQLQAKESPIRKLRAHIATLKGKNVSDNNESSNNASVIAPGMFRESLKQNPRDPYLEYALIISTIASGSQSKNNTRKNMIMPAASSNKKNKAIEVHPRKVMSSLNKMNRVSLCNANCKHVVKDANSKFVGSTCNGCLFSANHDQCVVTYTNDVNKRVKSKSSKSKKMEWKPTGKVFTSVGHRWLPTSRNFTIIGNQCPLTRITSNPIVPPKETNQTLVITPNPEVKVYRRRTKVAKCVSFNDAPSTLETRPSNILEPNKNWGSAVSNSPSSTRV
ncbi:hypothetical protein Tco_0745484 [Tanacetum coccineum]